MARLIETVNLPLERVTGLDNQHFFGYYYNAQFDLSDTKILALECDVDGRWQTPEDLATLGMVDLADGNKWASLGVTHSWNWQMGAMLQWLPESSSKIICNDRRNGRFVSVVMDIVSGEEELFCAPVYEVRPDGKSALTLNFSRLWDTRPETGYCGIPDPWGDDPAPDEDGIFRLDFESNNLELIISHSDLKRFGGMSDDGIEGKYYFTHLLYNESGSRFMFWHRRKTPSGLYSRIYTADPDGKNIHYVTDCHSHSAWFGDDGIVAWGALEPGKEFHNYMFKDMSGEMKMFGEGILDFNGHFTFSPDKNWFLTDIPSDSNNIRTLVLYHPASDRRFDIARLYSKREADSGLRCDLHPRWDRSGTRVCLDSTHEGGRQIYLLDASGIVRGA